ncbi:cystathionine beta-lyase, partial [Streptomyces sp. NPDC059701]
MNEPVDSPETRYVHAGSDPTRQGGYVNPPVHHASTVLYRDVAEMDASQADPLKRGGPVYGRGGPPPPRARAVALSERGGGHAAVGNCSGLSAITPTILAY